MTELEPFFVRYLDEPIEVDPTGCRTVAALIEKAKAKFSPELDSFSLCDITLHLYTGTKLKGDMKISELCKPPFKNNYDTPLLIRHADALLPVVKKIKVSHPSEERRKRWEELNPILIQAKIDAASESKEKNLEESSVYLLNWRLISPVYELIMHHYSQPVKEVPQSTMDLLYPLVVATMRRYGSITNGKELQRLFFIHPILLYVAELFGPEDPMKILADEELKGVHVKATVHFEFILKRNNKRICIVLAKKDDMAQGMAQNLVGMEVVSDLDTLDIVYGIVTNYVEWIFLKSQNDKIERHMDVMNIDEFEVATVESLKRIAGKIYALLSDA